MSIKHASKITGASTQRIRAKDTSYRRRFRKLSFGLDEEAEEVRSVAEISSCSGELNSNSSDASCSQSDISLCDDGGSEDEAGEGDGILGQLHETASDDGRDLKGEEDLEDSQNEDSI